MRLSRGEAFLGCIACPRCLDLNAQQRRARACKSKWREYSLPVAGFSSSASKVRVTQGNSVVSEKTAAFSCAVLHKCFHFRLEALKAQLAPVQVVAGNNNTCACSVLGRKVLSEPRHSSKPVSGLAERSVRAGLLGAHVVIAP